MAYNPANVNNSNTDYISVVRFLIDDKDAEEILDAEITALYANTDSGSDQAIRNFQTAVQAAQYLHTKYAKQATFSSAGTSVQLLERAKYWASVVQDLAYRTSEIMGSVGITYIGRNASW